MKELLVNQIDKFFGDDEDDSIIDISCACDSDITWIAGISINIDEESEFHYFSGEIGEITHYSMSKLSWKSNLHS